MARVEIPGELQKFTGDKTVVLEASDYRTMIDELCAKYPKLDRNILTEMAVAIDGVIIVDPLLEPLDPETEVHFLHFVAGG